MRFQRFILIFIILFGFLFSSAILAAGDESESVSSERYFLPEPMRIFMKYMLDAKGKSESLRVAAFDQAVDTIAKWQAYETEIVSVSSLDEYLKIKYQDREAYTNLDFEIRHLNESKAFHKPRFEFTSALVAHEVSEYHERQFEFAKSKLLATISTEGTELEKVESYEFYSQLLLGSFVKAEMAASNNYDPQKYIQSTLFLKIVDTEHKLKLVNQFDQGFTIIENEIKNIGGKVAADDSKFKVKTATIEGVGRFIQVLLGGVFKNLTDTGVKNMISGGIDFPDQRSDIEKFQLVLGYGVPQLLKLLQLVARMEGLDPDIKKAFKALESGGRSVPLALIEEILASEAPELAKQGMRILRVDKAFHAGTIAQMHTVSLEYFDELGKKQTGDFALRVIKPGMDAKIGRGEQNMLKTALLVDSDPELRKVNWPKFEPSIKGLSEGIRHDVDTVRASKNQNLGLEYYSHSRSYRGAGSKPKFKVGKWFSAFPTNKVDYEIEFTVPKVVYFSDPNTLGNNFMIMEKVRGEKLADIKESQPELAENIARSLISRWMSTGFIEPGFIHADLHFGNFMVDLVYDEVTVKRKNSKRIIKVKVPIIDFGMGGLVSQDFRRTFTSLIIASKFREPNAIKNILWGLKTQSSISQVNFEKSFAKKYAEDEKVKLISERMKPRDWVIFSVNQGLEFPADFVSLSRGTGILLNLSVAFKIEKKLTGMMKLAFKDDPLLLKKVFQNGLVDYSLVKSLLLAKLGVRTKACKSIGSSK